MTQELRREISRIGNNITGIEDNFWYLEAGEKAGNTYAVFSEYANPQSYDSSSRFEEHYIQINVYAQTMNDAETIALAVTQAFDQCRDMLDVDGYAVDSVTRLSGARPLKAFDSYRLILEYKIRTTKN